MMPIHVSPNPPIPKPMKETYLVMEDDTHDTIYAASEDHLPDKREELISRISNMRRQIAACEQELRRLTQVPDDEWSVRIQPERLPLTEECGQSIQNRTLNFLHLFETFKAFHEIVSKDLVPWERWNMQFKLANFIDSPDAQQWQRAATSAVDQFVADINAFRPGEASEDQFVAILPPPHGRSSIGEIYYQTNQNVTG
eukprot:GHVH01010071.1.p1 GENE.GHVH01010071.1~~GHVH01010071.1.p1  ORF type:complete len:198 (+),score=23.20 GHVH01010071.1:517-1110(+)